MAITVPVPPCVLRGFFVCWARDKSHNILCFAPSMDFMREFIWSAFRVRLPLASYKCRNYGYDLPLKYHEFFIGTVSDYNKFCADRGLYEIMVASAHTVLELVEDDH